jgi:hypothetical protein
MKLVDEWKLAILFVASRVTVPTGLTQGAAHVTANLFATEAIGSLNVAVTVLLTGTATELLTGLTAVTVGAEAAGALAA